MGISGITRRASDRGPYHIPCVLLGPYRVTAPSSQPRAPKRCGNARTITAPVQPDGLEAAVITLGVEQGAIAIWVPIGASDVICKVLTLCVGEERDPRAQGSADQRSEQGEAQARRHGHHGSGQVLLLPCGVVEKKAATSRPGCAPRRPAPVICTTACRFHARADILPCCASQSAAKHK